MHFQHKQADFLWRSLWWPISPKTSKVSGCYGPPIFNYSSVKHPHIIGALNYVCMSVEMAPTCW